MKFLCAHCGRFSSTKYNRIDSGLTLVCIYCGQVTVVDLFKPADRAALYAQGKPNTESV